MNEQTKQILYFSTMILFFVLLSLTVVSFYFIGVSDVPFIINIFVKYHVMFMFLIAIFGLIFGSLSYFLLNKKIDKNKKEMKHTISTLLDLLQSEEKKVILFLINNQGVSTQYELTKIEGMTKLKIHRCLEKLERKHIIKKEKLGKINKIYLNKEIKF
jgi:hypothetical protein